MMDNIELPSKCSIVRDMNLKSMGRAEINLAELEMPGLMAIRHSFSGKNPLPWICELGTGKKPLQGARITGCVHLTVQTAVLIETLVELGASIRWCTCNILSTQDEAAAAVASNPEIIIFAWKGQTVEEYWKCVEQALTWPDGQGPQLIIDDGGDASEFVHNAAAVELMTDTQRDAWMKSAVVDDEIYMRKQIIDSIKRFPNKWSKIENGVLGLSEETTTGITRLLARWKNGTLKFPVFNINDAVTKSKFDNIYGCRHSLLDGIYRSTDTMIAGKKALVCGFGDVGKGSAEALYAAGAIVRISEVDPICALQACMNGYQVVTIEEVLHETDIFITATGNTKVITTTHMSKMKDGAIVGNIGHFDAEIDVNELSKYPKITKERVKPQVDIYRFPNGNRIILLAEGRLLNLGCATGHPSFVMSCSFTNQVLAQLLIWKSHKESEPQPVTMHRIPKILDEHVARLHLPALGAKLTVLSEEQAAYIGVPIKGPYKDNYYRY